MKEVKPKVIKAEWTASLASPERDKRKTGFQANQSTALPSPKLKKNRHLSGGFNSPAKTIDPYNYMKRESPVRAAHLKAAAEARKKVSDLSPGKYIKEPIKRKIPTKKPSTTLNAAEIKQAWKKPSIPSHLLYGILAEKKKTTKVKRVNKSSNQVGTTTKKPKLNNWN